MNASDLLPPSTIRFIEKALSDGKPIGADLLRQYGAQTGRNVPGFAPSQPAKTKATNRRASRPPRGNRAFVAAHRDALAAVIEKVEGTDAAFCIAVYVALRWLAFEAYQPDGPFSTTVALVAHRSGLGYNTTSKAIKILESIAVVSVQVQRIAGTRARAPSLYTFPVIRDTFPTELPPRRAERYKKGEEDKESLSGACWPREVPLDEAQAIAAEHSCTVECVHRWYSTWVSKKLEFGDPKPASPTEAFARFKAAVHSDRNRPAKKGSHSSAFGDPTPPLPKWALDDKQLARSRELPRYDL